MVASMARWRAGKSVEQSVDEKAVSLVDWKEDERADLMAAERAATKVANWVA